MRLPILLLGSALLAGCAGRFPILLLGSALLAGCAGRLPILLLGSALLTGCAGLDAFQDTAHGIRDYFFGTDTTEPPAELKPLQPGTRLTVLWDEDVGKGFDGQFVNLVPAVTEERVFAADRTGRVEAFGRLKGDRLWSVDLELAFSAGPAAAGDKLFLGTANAELLALNAADGSIAWKAMLSSEILSVPKVEDGVVVVRSADGRLSGLDVDSGAARWNFDRSVPPLSVRSRGTPGVAEGMVLDGYASGKLVALGLTDGKQQWEATVALPHGRSEIDRLVDVNPEPVVRGDTVYVTGYHAGVDAVALKDGEVLWRTENLSSNTGLSATRRALFLTDVNSDVWRLDQRNGSDLWKQAELHQRRLTLPVPIKESLVVGDFEGYLHALSQEDGGLTGRVQIDDSPIETTPVVFDDIIYVYTAGGTLAAVSLE